MSIVIEFIRFLKARKKYWLVPIFIALFIIGGLIVSTQGTVVAPFIYAMF